MSGLRCCGRGLIQRTLSIPREKLSSAHLWTSHTISLLPAGRNVIFQPFSTSPGVNAPVPQTEFLIVIPDFPDTAAARTKAKPGHIRDATPLIDSGIITYFGVTLSDADAVNGPINGSAIVMKANNEAEVRAYLKDDEYTKLGVWDVEKAQIWRFRSG